MASARYWLLAAGWVVVAVLFGVAWYLYVRGMNQVAAVVAPQKTGTASVGTALPDAPLRSLDGKPTALRRFTAGHPVWINFFATWCTPCKAELPQIESRYRADGGRGLTVLGVDEQETPQAVAAFAKHFGVTYPLAIDEGSAADVFRVQTIPLSVFVDAHGIVRIIRIGQMEPSAMDEAVGAILGSP